jgi:CxxC motif-containing protein
VIIMNMTCIVCPNGCRMSVAEEGGEIKVDGAQCKKGIEFAKAEMTNPMRSLTTTVKTVFADIPKLPVKTNGEIPKGKMLEAMNIIKTVLVTERLHAGDVVLPDVFGVQIIATASMQH